MGYSIVWVWLQLFWRSKTRLLAQTYLSAPAVLLERLHLKIAVLFCFFQQLICYSDSVLLNLQLQFFVNLLLLKEEEEREGEELVAIGRKEIG